MSRRWRPVVLSSGRIVAFHGYFDNAAAIGAELDADIRDVARLYGLAFERWGDDAERRIIGEYCAVIVDRESQGFRLSRSPLRAPPLFYSHNEHLTAVASVPRALFGAGVAQRLNEVRVADSALLNFTDPEASWFCDVARVPLGCAVELERGRPRILRKCYDVHALPKVQMKSDADYIARATELLNEGVRACLTGFSRPGATLSGGLDSPQVAVRALASLPAGRRLPTFTFHPEEGYDGLVESGMIGDERATVEAFAALHPGLETHYTANEGYEHDHRWNELFHLMGGAPSGLCNMYVFHGLFSEASKKGCDVLLLAEWGNNAFSDNGDWGLVEYFVKGQWRQLWLALARRSDGRSMLWRFLAHSIVPMLPNRFWYHLRRVMFPKDQFLLDLIQPLSGDYRLKSGAEQRLRDAGIIVERYQPTSQRHAHKLQFQNNDWENAEVYQAFEQMYGVAQRDPMAYRPFVEFCFGLPTNLFLRDGNSRWLAKEMAKGLMPEEQRANRLNGRWDADWHLRIGRRRGDFRAELDRLAKNSRIASMLDLPRLRAALEDWPDQTETNKQKYFARELGVPRGLLTARFVNYIEGRNDT